MNNTISTQRQLCSICIPVYNESECIISFLKSLLSCIEELELKYNIDFEIIAVDDGSSDNTLDLLLSFAANHNSVSVYAFQINCGHQAAILCCMSHSNGDFIVTMDSDGQDPPESLDSLLTSYLDSSYEVVIAKRRTRRDSVLKKTSAWFFYRILTLLGLPKESEDSGDFRIMSKRVKQLLLAQPQSLQYIRGQIFTLKVAIMFIYIDRKQRLAGITKYSLAKMLRLATSSAYVVDPMKLAQLYIVFAAILFLTTMISILSFVIIKLYDPTYFSSGTTTLALLILSLFSITFAVMSLQGLYMSLIFKNLRNDPVYIEKENLQ